MLRRLTSSLKSWLGSSTEPDPAPPTPDVDAAIEGARLRDQQLRNEAARAIGEKIVLRSRIEELAAVVGESMALARESLVRSDDALSAGDEGGSAKWTELARAYAGSLRASEEDLASLRSRYRDVWNNAEEAKSAIRENAAGLEELSGGQDSREIMGNLTGTLSTSIEDETPSPGSLDSLVDRVEGESSARADIQSLGRGRHEGPQAVNMTEADARLEALRAELDR